MSTRRGFALVLCLIAGLAGVPASAVGTPSSGPVPFPVVDGSVRALLVDGDTAYVGGHFRSVGNLTGPLAFVGPTEGRVRRGFPTIAGFAQDEALVGRAGVRAVVPDGKGGLYVGGHFGRVAGKRRSALVHLRADGSVDPRFRADVEGRVHALELAGGRLWIGGSFARVAGRERRDLAVVDASTGALSPITYNTFGPVDALERAGSRMYLGGRHQALAALDAATGEPLPWAVQRPTSPAAIVARGDKVYVASANVLEISAVDGRLLREYRVDSPEVRDLAVAGHVLVAGGQSHTDTKRALFAFDRRTGQQLPQFADVRAEVFEIAVHRGTAYVSHVRRPGSELRGGVVAFDLQTGRRRWSLDADTIVNEMFVHRGRLVVAGQMRMLGAVRREHLAAIHLPTGRVKRFNARIDGVPSSLPGRFFIEPFVSALAKRGRELYVGGYFDEVRGRRQYNLAAVDAVTGRRRDTLTGADGRVYALARAGSTLYVGGEIYSLGAGPNETPRLHLGAIDLRSGRVTPWNPAPSHEVRALAVSRADLHVGGQFGEIAGRVDVPGLAAFDLKSGGLSTRFPPPPIGGTVLALAGDGRGGVWIGGALGALDNGETRGLSHLGANGRPAARVPDVEGDVTSLAARGDMLYLGGTFRRVGGKPRRGFAAVRARRGAVTAFNPGPSASGWTALAPLPRGGLLAGGPFTGMELRATSGLARFRR